MSVSCSVTGKDQGDLPFEEGSNYQRQVAIVLNKCRCVHDTSHEVDEHLFRNGLPARAFNAQMEVVRETR